MRPFAVEWKGFVAMFQLGGRLERVLFVLCVGILALFAFRHDMVCFEWARVGHPVTQGHTNTASADNDGLCHACPC